MGLLGKIWVKLGLDNSEFNKEIKESQGAAGKFKNSLGAIGSTIAAAFSVSAIISFGRKAVQEFAAAELAAAKLNSVLKATGGAVGLNTEQLQEYAREREKATAVDGDAIIDAMAKLASFKSIQGEVFKSAINSAQDLATVWGTDLNSQILALGKALEDPERGLTALRRSGTMFTDTQIEGFKKLLSEGKKQEVQLEILAEIQRQYGGAAEDAANTTIGGWKKVGIAWDNFMESLGGGLKNTTALAKTLVGTIEFLTKVLTGSFPKGSIGYYLFNSGGKDFANERINAAEEWAKSEMEGIKSISDAQKRLSDLKATGRKGYTLEGLALRGMLEEYIKTNTQSQAIEKARQEAIRGTTQEIEEQIATLEKQRKEATTNAERQAITNKIQLLKEELDVKNGVITADELARRKALENAELVKGTIPYQEKLIKLKQEEITLTNDDSKRASLSQELANLEHRLAVMKLTTDELRAYNMLVARDIRAGGEIPYVSARPKGKIAPLNLDKEGKKIDPILSYRNRFQSGSLPDLEAQLKRYKDLYNRIDATPAQREFFKEQIDGLEAGIKGLSDGMNDFNKEFNEEVLRSANIAANFGQAVAQSMSDSMKQIFDAISSGEKIDASAMTKAILMPFADMAVQIGEVMVATGAAALAAKAIGKVGGPGAAIAAGAVLMALGAAAQSQIGRIGSSFGAGSSSDPYSYTGGAAVSNVSNQPIQVYGVLKGQDIYLSSEKYKQNKSR